MAFLMLVTLIWADAVLDLSTLFFRLPETRFNWYRACILTASVIVVGFITIAHAYVQQKKALKGLIKICSYCHRVQVDEQAWRRMEIDVGSRGQLRGVMNHYVANLLGHKPRMQQYLGLASG